MLISNTFNDLGKGGVEGSIPSRGTSISRHAETSTQPVPAESLFNFGPGTFGTGYRRPPADAPGAGASF